LSIKSLLTQTLDDLEAVAKLFSTPVFDIYFLGGAACVLGGYTERATRDFDFVDLNYDSSLGRVFTVLRDYDMLEYESAVLASDYRERAKKLDKYTAFNAYILSPEDIAVSKIIRLSESDIQDIDALMDHCDKELINKIIDNVLTRDDLFDSKKQGFKNNLQSFRERYDV